MGLGREDNLLSNTYESGNLIAKIYFRWKVMTAIRLAGLKKEDVILDYGCGDGWLEHKLKNYNIHGYDLTKLLDTFGICIRSGHHCAQPILKKYNVTSLNRISLYFYNIAHKIYFV